MATITTSTANTAFSMAFGYPGQTMMDVHPVTGDLWMMMRTTGTQMAIFKSTDKGASWSAQGTVTRADLQDLCAMRIDSIGENMHILYFVSDSLDRVYYKRIPIFSGTAGLTTGEILVVSGGNSTPQTFLYAADLVPVTHPDGSITVAMAVSRHGTNSGAVFFGWTVKNDSIKTTVNSASMFTATRTYVTSGNDSDLTASIDVEHNGDGITSTNPNLWMSWQVFGTIYCVKATFNGYKTGWSTPSKAYTVATGRTTVRDAIGRWDGSRFLICSTRPSDTTKMDVYERPPSNTGASAIRTTASHPVGALGATAIATNHITKDFRILAVSGSSTVRYTDYIRASNTWTAWAQMSATAPITSEWGVRRTTYGTNQYDGYKLTGGGSPWTASNDIMSVNFAPTAPTWITGTPGTVQFDGAAFDVTSSLLLDWVFNDPNTADVQGSYALSRQIGAGAIQYWRASDSTWQASEVQNASATTQLTLTTGQWLGGGGAADPAHVYRVKTWDGAGAASSYSAGLSVIPSTRVDPTITAPTPSQVLNSGTVGVTWTVTEQSAFRIVVLDTNTAALYHDSGFIADPTPLTPSILDYTPPVVFEDGAQLTIQLTTRNAEGLQSQFMSRVCSIDYVEPASPMVTSLNAFPNLGAFGIVVTQPAPVGTQPVTVQLDCWRRVVTSTTPTNVNPYFETNTTDWVNVGYASIARSTAQFHQGVASLLLTPNGSTASPKTNTLAYTAAAGSRWEWRGWLRSTTANKTIWIALDWRDGGGSTISFTSREVTPVAGTWIYATIAGTAPVGTAGVRMAVGQLATPAAGDTLFVDEMVLIPANDALGTRIGTLLVSGQQFFDSLTVSGVDYEYRGYAEGANGTSTYGPWQS